MGCGSSVELQAPESSCREQQDGTQLWRGVGQTHPLLFPPAQPHRLHPLLLETSCDLGVMKNDTMA